MTTKKSSTDALGEILEKLGAMEDRLSDMEQKASAPQKLWVTEPVPEVDQIPEGTKVRLKETAERHPILMGKIDSFRPDVQESIKANGIIGTIGSDFYHIADGNHKYKVDFTGLGSWGVRITDMELVG
jgi:hypothetical protein